MIVYLSLGSNIGNKEQLIRAAISQLQEQRHIEVLAASSLLTTKPFGFHNQPDFLNCTLRIDTSLSPTALLDITQQIENVLGRKRDLRWGPRTIDIDILFYGNKIIERENLLIPHPATRHRAYVLHSLKELCPDYIHPLFRRTIKDLYTIITEI